MTTYDLSRLVGLDNKQTLINFVRATYLYNVAFQEIDSIEEEGDNIIIHYSSGASLMIPKTNDIEVTVSGETLIFN